MTDRDENAPPRTTLFVRNLPFDINAQKLEEEFSKFGPIKKAFVVKDKDNASRCRGFGYVQFVLQADTDKALKAKLCIGNRDLKCSYANKKPKHEKRKKIENDKNDQTENKNLSNEENQEQKASFSQPNKNIKFKKSIPIKDENIQNVKSTSDEKTKCVKEKLTTSISDPNLQNTENQKPISDLQRTLVISGLTAKVKRKNIRILCEQFGEIENIVYPVSDRVEVTAFVRFKDFKSTIRAVQKIKGQKVKKSNTLSAVLLTKEGKFPSKKVQQKSRLIIRNLSFKCEEQDIRDSFSVFGKVIDIKIPTKTVNNKSLKIGCAFVQFDNEINAKIAMEKMNLKEIKGRPVVVDWAIEKDEYQSQKKEKEVLPNKNGNISLNQEIEEKPNKGIKSSEKFIEDFEDSVEKEENQEDDNSTQDDDEGSHDDSNNEGFHDDSNNEDSDDLYKDEDDDKFEEKILPKKQLKDAKEGKTVFIRNLSYNTSEEEIEEEFKKFGEIEYCKLVVDQQTGSSRGSAFVKFKEVESAEACVKQTSGENQNSVSIDGRALVVSLAVTKGKVNEIVREKMDAKKETDKRNLYLAYEGMITRNSPAAEGLSDADLKKREKALIEKKAKLKNPNYFVSRTRLSVRNLPLNINSIELKDVFLKAVKNDDIKITNVKIMTSKDRKDSKGMPRSLGFGFLEVGVHEHALAILRAANNNPDLFGKNRRPIVEFAIENAKALKIQEFKQKKIAETLSRTENTQINKKSERQKQREKKYKRIERYHRKREAKRLEKMKSESKSTLPENVEKAVTKSNASLPKKDVADLLNDKNDKKIKQRKKNISKIKNEANIVLHKNPPHKEQEKFDVEKPERRSEKRRNDEKNLKLDFKKPRQNIKEKVVKKTHQTDEDKFNALVNKYKNKIILNDSEQSTKKKWFE
ncbi:RNA-binding protein 28-like [Hydra vulgaris]|uniref:RNA-binding protein 28-like n=1 Tax=Hydra vulgaris TaxID=6087 RepID=A0ABM4DND7_HYDVU